MIKNIFERAELKNIEFQAFFKRNMKCGVDLCVSCCMGINKDISFCKDGPIFNSEELRKFPQFRTHIK